MLQGIISALCLPVTRLTAARHHQCPMPPCYKAHCCKASSVPYICLPVTRLTAARHHRCPMPPCYKAHCCKASSVPYASLLQDSLLQAPLPAYLASVLCVIIAFIQRCVGLCFIRVVVWSGLCFIHRRSGLVWSGLVWSVFSLVPSPSFSRVGGRARIARGRKKKGLVHGIHTVCACVTKIS